MTIEDVDWMLRYPSDELVMSRETFNQVQTAIAVANRDMHLLTHIKGLDSSGRMTSVPTDLAGRKLTLTACDPQSPGDGHDETRVTFRVKGVAKAQVVFP